ncbi:hypothetical protein A9Q78_02990 [Methylophaga sp. 41_12_T18]|nr:hypothetical protein A9Q78_02990 [Methylophaga sp. 41_12_T18]
MSLHNDSNIVNIGVQFLWGRSFPFNFIDLPPVLLGDCETVTASPGVNNALREFDIEAAYNELVEGQLWVERFSKACA